MKYINIAEPCLGIEEWNAVREPIETGWLTQGPKVKEFEMRDAFIRETEILYYKEALNRVKWLITPVELNGYRH